MSKPAPTDFESWLRETERRLTLLERRPAVRGGEEIVEGSHYTAGDGLVVEEAATHGNPLDPESLGIVSVGQGTGVLVSQNAVSLDLAFTDERYGGRGSAFYKHTQAMLSTLWTVEHDLGFHPAVHAEDSAGNIIFGSVQHVSDQVLTISYQTAITGLAYCS